MKTYMYSRFIIVLTVYRLAKKYLPKKPGGRGPKRYSLASKMAVIAWIVLSSTSYRRALNELALSGFARRIGLEGIPSPASVSRWKVSMEPYVRFLIRLSFFRLARMRKKALASLLRGALGETPERQGFLGIADGTGFRLGRGSTYYEDVTGKRRSYLRLVALYAPEIDAFYDAAAVPSEVSEVRAFRDYLLEVVIEAKIFWGLMTDKAYDSSEIIARLERAGIIPMIPARGGKLRPKAGPRLRSNRNYETFTRLIGNMRSLVESAFSSMKSMALDVIRSQRWEARIVDALTIVLAYNAARLIAVRETSR